jgi:hypothetical protein
VERVKIDSGWSEVSGLVTDPTGVVVSGAEVSLKGLGFEKHAKSDKNGKFRFESLRPDLRYELSIEREGFVKYLFRELYPTSGEALSIKAQLNPHNSQPYAPVEENRSPVAIGESSVSSATFNQPIDPCAQPDPKPARSRIESKRGQIAGTITDQMGAVVPGIKLKLILDKRTISTVTSDATGSFSFSGIKPAKDYALRIEEQQGWKKQVIDGINVDASEKIVYGICIQVSNVYEVVGLYGQPSKIRLEGSKPAIDVFRQRP